MNEEKQEYINEEYKEMLVNHEKRLDIANSEMGVVKNDVAWIKGIIEKLDLRVWLILSGIILTILLQIAFRLW